MKKTLLFLSLFASFSAFKAAAQESTFEIYDEAVFYSMYEGTVENQPLPENAQRNNNSSYGVKLTDEQIASFGSSLILKVQASSLCDNFDRIGNVNLAFVPKGATSYVYKDVERIEIGRFITPFQLPDSSLEVPYEWDVTNLVDLFHSPELTAEYDFWIELEIYGYQGSPTQGGAVADHPLICTGRNDVYKGSLQFVTSGTYTFSDTYFKKLSFKYELKDYTLEGTDELGETVKSYTFNVDKDITNAKYYFINSNHGSNSGGEEYIRRWHFIYLDGVEKMRYRPGGVSCVPYRKYNTQGNCIYMICDNDPSTPTYNPDDNAYWTWNNWCPGDKIPTRVVELGSVTSGEHTYKINVPSAVFNGDQGYFPMSVYVQGTYGTAGTDSFNKIAISFTPNPVNDIATINTNGDAVQSYQVVNTLGQNVLNGKGNSINMGGLQAGIYVVKAQFANGQEATSKLVKK